jgi:hypothetical protein
LEDRHAPGFIYVFLYIEIMTLIFAFYSDNDNCCKSDLLTTEVVLSVCCMNGVQGVAIEMVQVRENGKK